MAWGRGHPLLCFACADGCGERFWDRLKPVRQKLGGIGFPVREGLKRLLLLEIDWVKRAAEMGNRLWRLESQGGSDGRELMAQVADHAFDPGVLSRIGRMGSVEHEAWRVHVRFVETQKRCKAVNEKAGLRGYVVLSIELLHQVHPGELAFAQ